MPPPTRTTAGPYHYHTYDFVNSQPYTTTNAVIKIEFGPTQTWQFYSLERDLAGLEQEGQARNVPNIKLDTIGISTLGDKNVKVLSFGNRGNVPTAPTVVFTGGIHAREWAAPEMAYLLAEYLIINYNKQPPPGNPYARMITDLIDTRNIYIIPMLNPDGNDYTVFGQGKTDGQPPYRWRKNRRRLPASGDQWVNALTWEVAPDDRRPNYPFQDVRKVGSNSTNYRVPDFDPAHGIPPLEGHYQDRAMTNNKTGVDLNRNCATTGWGFDARPNDTASANWNPQIAEYFGPHTASERETRNIQGFLAKLKPKPSILIDYHSYGKFILYPPEISSSGRLDPEHIATGQTLDALIESRARESYQLGTTIDLFGYNGTGGLIDYAAMVYGAHTFAIELDPAADDPAGFMLPEDDIRTMFEKNIRGALAAIAVPTAETRDVIASKLLKWNVYDRGNELPEWP